MPRQNLVLCEQDDRRVQSVMDRIYTQADELAMVARGPAPSDQRYLIAAEWLRWAGHLLSGKVEEKTVARVQVTEVWEFDVPDDIQTGDGVTTVFPNVEAIVEGCRNPKNVVSFVVKKVHSGA